MRNFDIVLSTLLVLITASIGFAQEQDEHHRPTTQPQQEAPGQTPQPPPAGAGPAADMGGMQMMQMMQSMHPAIALDETAVYIVRGKDVIKLDKKTLHVLSRATLPAVQMQGMPEAMGRGPGMQGMMQRPEMQNMMSRMKQMPAEQLDREFMQNMIRHHSGAIAISQLAAQKAERPELRRFAQQVVDDQTRENQQLSQWLRNWYSVTAQTTPMPMDAELLTRLRTLEGRQFDVEYIQAMIMHHQEGVSMAQIAEERATRTEVKASANQIVRDQSMEVEQLKNWLSQWYGVSA